MATTETRPIPHGHKVVAPLQLPWWLTPAVFILVPVGMSFSAWVTFAVLGEFGYITAFREMLTGFAVPATITLGGIGLLVFWYCAMVATSMVGWRFGADRFMPVHIAARTSSADFERRYFLVILVTAAIGVGYSYVKIASQKSIIDALANQSGNDFTKSLSGTAGVETLRYAVILAAPLGIYLWRKKVVTWPYMLASVVLIAANSLIASRLSLLMASAVFVVTTVRSNADRPKAPRKTNRFVQLIAIFLVGFLALAVLNFFRNANYYREAGVTSPAAMNLYQMGTYLAVPAQVTIGVAGAIAEGRYVEAGDRVDSMDAIQPTFLQFTKVSKDESWKYAVFYNYSVAFAPSFFTNSVFADTYAVFGVWGWFYTFLLYGAAGYMFARFMRYGPVVAGSGGVLGYCFAEVWRIQIVNYGIVIFLLLLTVGSSWLAQYWTRHRAHSQR